MTIYYFFVIIVTVVPQVSSSTGQELDRRGSLPGHIYLGWHSLPEVIKFMDDMPLEAVGGQGALSRNRGK